MHENLRKMVEIKNMSNQLKSYSSWEQPAFIGWGGGVPFTHSMTASDLVNYYNALQSNDILRNNRNIGFLGRVCYNCLFYWADVVFNNEEETKSLMKEKPPSHKCDPKKVVKSSVQDIESKKKQMHKDLIDFLVLMFGQNTVVLYLKAEELALPYADFSLPYRKNNTWIDDNNNGQSPLWGEKEDHYINIDLDNIEQKEKHWAYRVIKEGHEKSVIIKKEDLIDFFKIAKATFGAFQVKIDGSLLYLFMYLKLK
jgi:hypothetical protein